MKQEALRIIHNCALEYKDNLVNKNIIFITLCNGSIAFFETAYLPRNFLHLTGVNSNLKSVDFYDLAVRDRLNERDFHFNSDGTTNQKLMILPKLMKIHMIARMVGDYDNSKSLLITDKIAGTVGAAMGFTKNGENESSLYVPNTALNTDMRLITRKPVKRVAMIFIKNKYDDRYYELTYIAKGLTFDLLELHSNIKTKIDEKRISASFRIPYKELDSNY